MWQSFNSERAGAATNRVKMLGRTGLNQASFNSCVFGTLNNIPVKILNTPRLVSKWRADGHLAVTTFRSSEEDQSKVMKRHLRESKPLRFLLSKEEALAS